jgi:hypothetical protein
VVAPARVERRANGRPWAAGKGAVAAAKKPVAARPAATGTATGEAVWKEF